MTTTRGAGSAPLASRLAVWSAAHAPTVVGFVLLLTGLAAWFAAAHLTINTDTNALINPQVAWRVNERELNRAFPQNGEVLVVVVDGATPERAETAARALTEAMRADTRHFHDVRRPDGGPFFDRNGLLYLSADEVRATADQLAAAQPFLGPLAADPSLRGVARSVETLATGVERGDIKLAQVAGPLGTIDRALGEQAAGRPAFFSWQKLFAGKGPGPGTRKLVLAVPVLNYTDLQPGSDAAAALRATATRLKLSPQTGVTVRLTGPVPLADEEFASLQHNIGFVAVLMGVFMVGTLWIALRSRRIMGVVLASTIAGLVLTTALGLAIVGRLTLISVAFIPLFVGLGIDFGIQLATRFREERLGGQPRPEALRRATAKLGRSLMLAAGAIALGFCAFLPTDYIGIAELGIIAGLGMVVALVLTLTFLPAVLVLTPARPPTRSLGNAKLAWLDDWLVHNRRLVLGLFALSMAVSVAALPLVKFDFNPLNLRDPKSESRSTLEDLMRDPDRTPNLVEIVAPDLAAADALKARLAKLPEVRGAANVNDLVPADQPAKLGIIADAQALQDLTLNPIDIAPPPSDADQRAALASAAAALQRAAAADPAGAGLARGLAGRLNALASAGPDARARATALFVPPLELTLDQLRASLSPEAVTVDSLPPEIKRDWLTPDGRARVVVFPQGLMQDNAEIARFTRAVETVAPTATGAPITIQKAARTIYTAFERAGIIALIAISLLLFAVLRSVREVAFTLAPVVLSMFLTLATCVAIGQPINFANIIAFPLLFGVGVAFHIYFVMAWADGITGLLQTSLARAVFFSALATGTAFGSLIVSSHPGTSSMGLVLAVSLVWTLVCALIFEPALLGPVRQD